MTKSPIQIVQFNGFSMFTELCTNITIYFNILKSNSVPINSHCQSCSPYPFYPVPQLQATTNLLFVSITLPIMNILYKLNHTTYGPQCPASFTQHNVLKFILVVTCISTSFLFVDKQYSIAWIYILFVYSSADEHKDCFYFLATMNNAGLNICLQVLVWTCFNFSWVYTQECNHLIKW